MQNKGLQHRVQYENLARIKGIENTYLNIVQVDDLVNSSPTHLKSGNRRRDSSVGNQLQASLPARLLVEKAKSMEVKHGRKEDSVERSAVVNSQLLYSGQASTLEDLGKQLDIACLKSDTE